MVMALLILVIVAADKEYFVEIMKNAYMMMEGTTSTLQENETVNYYKVATVDGEEQADTSPTGKWVVSRHLTVLHQYMVTGLH